MLRFQSKVTEKVRAIQKCRQRSLLLIRLAVTHHMTKGARRKTKVSLSTSRDFKREKITTHDNNSLTRPAWHFIDPASERLSGIWASLRFLSYVSPVVTMICSILDDVKWYFCQPWRGWSSPLWGNCWRKQKTIQMLHLLPFVVS